MMFWPKMGFRPENGFGKLKQEEIVREIGRNQNIPFVVLRPGTIYGPGKTNVGIASPGYPAIVIRALAVPLGKVLTSTGM